MKSKKSFHYFFFILSTLVVPVFAWMLTQMGGIFSLKNLGFSTIDSSFTAHAVTNNRHTMKLEDVAAGKAIRVGNTVFIALGDNTYQSSTVGSLECGEHSHNDPVNDFLCLCDTGYYTNATGGIAYDHAGGSCSFKKCGSGTTGTYVDANSGTCTCSSGKFSNTSGGTTVAIGTGTCSYNKYCTGTNVTVQYATSQPTCACKSGYFADGSGSTTPTNTGSCKYITRIYDFGFTGDAQTFDVPVAGKYKVELWGASGSNDQDDAMLGCHGAYTSGEITLTAHQKLYIYVGANHSTFNNSTGGKSGGGATDIRTISGVWNNANSLRSRIMVAAGGGGHNGHSNQTANSSSAGGLTGYDGASHPSVASSYIGRGASQTGGGSGHGGNGSFGVAGNAGTYTDGHVGGSGGGGWYGGGGSTWHAGGGGGSSYISGHTGCVAVTSTSSSSPKSGCSTGTSDNSCSVSPYGLTFSNTVMIDGAGYQWTNTKGAAKAMPNPDGGSFSDGNENNGYARITFIADSSGVNSIDPSCSNGYFWSDKYNTCYACPSGWEVLANKRGCYMNFGFTGDAQTFDTPLAGKYKLEVWGAQGGNTVASEERKYFANSGGGKGGFARGTITLAANTRVYVYVGGQGGSVTGGTGSGGYNGGASGGDKNNTNNEKASGGAGGGGASDIRIGSTSLYARVIVAGGGGGGGGRSGNTWSWDSLRAGGGGGSVGASGGRGTENTVAGDVLGGNGGGAGGTTSGGSGGTSPTSTSRNEGGHAYSGGGGGGGGGWYGGGGGGGGSLLGMRGNTGGKGTFGSGGVGGLGAGTCDINYLDGAGGGGGGGSNYVYTSQTANQYPSGCTLNSAYYLSDTHMEDRTGHVGNGSARVTLMDIM